jgi:hypothetical protein
VTVALPDKSSPYLDSHAPHDGRMTVRELVERLEAGERCYLNQSSIGNFAGLWGEIDLELITVPPLFGVNVWLGGRTRSGLHYDTADNFLIQIFGVKHATLIAPSYGRSLSLMPDNPSKSTLSPDEIEAPAVGRLSSIHRWQTTLNPGDALYIPRGWWHYLASVDQSISLNVWHGDRCDFKHYCAAFVRAGPTVWVRTVRDFVWCGALHRPYEQHLFSPPPFGLTLYSQVFRQG